MALGPCPRLPKVVASRPLTLLVALFCASGAAHATVAVLQPAREAAASQPLELTLLYTDDDRTPLSVEVPKQLTVSLTNGDLPPVPLTLARDPDVPDHLRLAPGQYRRVRFFRAVARVGARHGEDRSSRLRCVADARHAQSQRNADAGRGGRAA